MLPKKVEKELDIIALLFKHYSLDDMVIERLKENKEKNRNHLKTYLSLTKEASECYDEIKEEIEKELAISPKSKEYDLNKVLINSINTYNTKSDPVLDYYLNTPHNEIIKECVEYLNGKENIIASCSIKPLVYSVYYKLKLTEVK